MVSPSTGIGGRLTHVYLLSVVDDFLADSALNQPIGVDELVKNNDISSIPKTLPVKSPPTHITVKLETGIIQNKVDPASLHASNLFGDLVEIVTQNILLGSRQVLSSGRLQLLDVLLGHVDQQRQVGRVTPETNCTPGGNQSMTRIPPISFMTVKRALLTLSKLPEHQLGSPQLVLVRSSLGEREGRSESRGELEDGLGGSSKGVALLPKEDV
jgi:hypothetical protein